MAAVPIIRFGSEQQVNTYVTSTQEAPSVTTLGDGGWLVTWQSLGQDGSGYGIYQQRYDASGNTVGGETKVNTTTFSFQFLPRVTALKDGGWLVTWQSMGQDSSGYGVYQQRYDADGNSIGGETQVNTTSLVVSLCPVSQPSRTAAGWSLGSPRARTAVALASTSSATTLTEAPLVMRPESTRLHISRSSIRA